MNDDAKAMLEWTIHFDHVDPEVACLLLGLDYLRSGATISDQLLCRTIAILIRDREHWRSVGIGETAQRLLIHPNRVRSKVRRAMKRGLVNGCICGCWGSLQLTEAGWDLADAAEVTP